MDRLVRVLGSRRFFWGVLTFFVFEAVWVALSAVYPMAFDEDVHFGIIKIYSDHGLPFLGSQPPNADAYGALQADPSYLYHYLMSFPYHLIAWLTHSEMAQVILLRLLNIGLFAYGLVLFRRLLLRVDTSQPLTHTALALCVLIPIVPLLAGQINYDNLLFPLVAVSLLLTLDVVRALRARQLPLKLLSLFVITCAAASLVKYAFLPMALVLVGYASFVGVRTFWRRGELLKRAVRTSYRGLSKTTKVVLIIGLVLAGGLWLQRYGVNTVKYGRPLPACDVVIGVDACSSYGPWVRNYTLAQTKGAVDSNPLAYTWRWLQGLHYRLFFTISGPANLHENFPPAPLPSAAIIVIGIFGTGALVFYWRETLSKRPFLVLLLGLTLTYIAALWFENYSTYLETGQPVAINGRYLIPVLLPLAAVFGRALSVALRPWPILKPIVASLAILLCLQAGGVFSFILRSDADWYWPNQFVTSMNDTVRQAIDPLMFQGPKNY